jgi:transcription elongation factor Elf1
MEKSKTVEDFLEKIEKLSPEDYLGIRVKDSIRDKEKKEGVIIGVKYDEKNKVKRILIRWNNNAQEEWIEVEDIKEKYPKEIDFKCPKCGGNLSYDDIMLSFVNKKALICPHCGNELCRKENEFPIPILIENENSQEKFELIKREVSPKKYLLIKPNKSKFLETEGVFFASPAGRVIVEGEYFTIKRKYKMPQPLISEYLRFWKEKRKISTKEIDEKLGYSYTAGHWLRADFGEWGKEEAYRLLKTGKD